VNTPGTLPGHAGTADQSLLEMPGNDLEADRRAVGVESCRQREGRLAGCVIDACEVDQLFANLRRFRRER
jgi:hypothetical protein